MANAQAQPQPLTFSLFKPTTWKNVKILKNAAKDLDANNFYYNNELKRWVERGKENVADAALAPPPKVLGSALSQPAAARRALADRYVLQKNLAVSQSDLSSQPKSQLLPPVSAHNSGRGLAYPAAPFAAQAPAAPARPAANVPHQAPRSTGGAVNSAFLYALPPPPRSSGSIVLPRAPSSGVGGHTPSPHLPGGNAAAATSILAAVVPRAVAVPAAAPVDAWGEFVSSRLGADSVPASPRAAEHPAAAPDTSRGQPGHQSAAAVSQQPDAVPAGRGGASAATAAKVHTAMQQAVDLAMAKADSKFDAFFDEILNPRDPRKLNGAMPWQLPAHQRHSDDWLKHCKAAQRMPVAVSAAPAAAPQPWQQPRALAPAPSTPVASKAFAAAPPVTDLWAAADAGQGEESESCRRALQIARIGLPAIMSPAASTRSVSAALEAPRAEARQASSILDRLELRLEQQRDTASSRPAAPAAAAAQPAPAPEADAAMPQAAPATATAAVPVKTPVKAAAGVGGARGARAASNDDVHMGAQDVSFSSPTQHVQLPPGAAPAAAPQAAVVPAAAAASLEIFSSPLHLQQPQQQQDEHEQLPEIAHPLSAEVSMDFGQLLSIDAPLPAAAAAPEADDASFALQPQGRHSSASASEPLAASVGAVQGDAPAAAGPSVQQQGAPGPTTMDAPGAQAAATAPAASGAGPSGSGAGPSVPAAAPLRLQDIVKGVVTISELKQTLLSDQTRVDAGSITNLIKLKAAVDHMLTRTEATAAAAAAASSSEAAAPQPALAPPAARAPTSPGASSSCSSAAAAKAGRQQQRGAPSGATSMAATNATAWASPTHSVTASASGPALANSGVDDEDDDPFLSMPPAAAAAGIAHRAPGRQSSAAAAGLPHAAPVQHPHGAGGPAARPGSLSRHHKAAQALAAAAQDRRADAEVSSSSTARGAAAAVAVAVAGPPVLQRGAWQMYEHKISQHRLQLDSTRNQLDSALTRLNEMQGELDDMLLALGLESAKNEALCEALRAAGVDPDPIVAAVEDAFLNGQDHGGAGRR